MWREGEFERDGVERGSSFLLARVDHSIYSALTGVEGEAVISCACCR